MSVFNSAFLAFTVTDGYWTAVPKLSWNNSRDGKIPNGPFPYSCQTDFIKKKHRQLSTMAIFYHEILHPLYSLGGEKEA